MLHLEEIVAKFWKENEIWPFYDRWADVHLISVISNFNGPLLNVPIIKSPP